MRNPLSVAFLIRAALLASASSLAVMAACAPRVATDVVARRDVTATAVVSGSVDAAGRVQIGAVTPGVVSDVPVVEGQAVKKGDLLLRFDDRVEAAALSQARASVAQARARLAELRTLTNALALEEKQQADIAVAQAERAAGRARRLAAAGGVTAVEAEDADAALALAQSRRAAAAARAAATADGGAQVQVAEAGVLAAEAAMRQAEAQLEQRRVVALVDAVVLARSAEPGDTVPAGRTLLVLAREGSAKLKVQPDEKTLGVLRVGQKAVASADAFPDARFDAVVSKISPVVDTGRGTVDVELVVDAAPAFLRTDMTVSVEIVLEEKRAALVVSQDAVRDLATASPWVLVAGAGGTAEKRPLRLGVRSGSFVEVVAGLVEGERVVVGSPALTPGARVKAGAT